MDLKADIRLYILSAVTGFLVGLVSVVFIWIMREGTKLLWPSGTPGYNVHSWMVVIVLTIAGLIMGYVVKNFGVNDGVGFEPILAKAKVEGEVKWYMIPRVVLNAFIGLIAGASIGPEAPLISLGGYISSWLGHRLKLTKEQIMAVTSVGIGASLGVLLESPIAGPLAIAESDDKLPRVKYFTLIFSIMIASGVGLALFL